MWRVLLILLLPGLLRAQFNDLNDPGFIANLKASPSDASNTFFAIPGLYFWFDSARGVTKTGTTNGAPLTAIIDQADKVNPASLAGTPSLKWFSDGDGLGTNTYLRMTNSGGISTSNASVVTKPWVAMGVFRRNGTGGNLDNTFFGTDVSQAQQDFVGYSATSNAFAYTDGTLGPPNGYTNGPFILLTWIHNGTDQILRTNGVQYRTKVLYNSGWRWRVMFSSAAGQNYWVNGDFVRALCWTNRVFTSNELWTAEHQNLNDYGLPIFN